MVGQVHKEIAKFEGGKNQHFKDVADYGAGKSDATRTAQVEFLWRDYMLFCTRKFGPKLFHYSDSEMNTSTAGRKHVPEQEYGIQAAPQGTCRSPGAHPVQPRRPPSTRYTLWSGINNDGISANPSSTIVRSLRSIQSITSKLGCIRLTTYRPPCLLCLPGWAAIYLSVNEIYLPTIC